MRGAVIYFSGTGNTEFVANLFKNELCKNGNEVELFEVTKRKFVK